MLVDRQVKEDRYGTMPLIKKHKTSVRIREPSWSLILTNKEYIYKSNKKQAIHIMARFR